MIFLVPLSLLFLSFSFFFPPQSPPFSVVEASIADMQLAMRDKRVTSRVIVQQYLDRIAKYEDRLNAVITLNPRALEEADLRDRERAKGVVRGPLHGVPIALKDNIHTHDMATTGGALAFKGFIPPYDATVTRLLREAGAIIIAKTNMTELANWMATGMPGNYNSVAGFGFNPYDPRPDPRDATGRPALTPAGSSSGAGTSANFWAANVGTETSGSILSPANQTMIVGIKPTVGRISRYGVIPLTADQDTAGPMARTVADAAVLLGVLEGSSPDPRDEATKACPRVANGDYTRFLNARGLEGARIGVPGGSFVDERVHGAVLRDALAILRQQGAVVFEQVELAQPPPVCRDSSGVRGSDDNCSIVFKYGMKRDFNAWLATLGPKAPVKTLSQLREWNLAHREEGTLRYGQVQLDNSDAVDLEADRARYLADRERDIRLSGAEGIDAALKKDRLDALIFPGSVGAAVAAKPGYPTVIVPFGLVPNAPTPPFPDGFDAKPAPMGISFTGTACGEPRLIELAYAFEQATRGRVPPREFP